MDRWVVNDSVELRGGVLNLFDRGPETYPHTVDAYTDPSTYDVIGRRFWIGLTLRLWCLGRLGIDPYNSGAYRRLSLNRLMSVSATTALS